eukprot:2366310-Prymnesium_polylepis.1
MTRRSDGSQFPISYKRGAPYERACSTIDDDDESVARLTHSALKYPFRVIWWPMAESETPSERMDNTVAPLGRPVASPLGCGIS